MNAVKSFTFMWIKEQVINGTLGLGMEKQIQSGYD